MDKNTHDEVKQNSLFVELANKKEVLRGKHPSPILAF